MYEWPKDLDVNSVFIGRELETITFAQYSIYLRLGEELLLSIMSDCVYTTDKITEEITFPVRQTNIIFSIGSKIVKVELIDKKDICLWFEDGAKLEVNGSTKQYECYSVNFKGREFYV